MPGLWPRSVAFGNGAADARAKEAAGWHTLPGNLTVSLNRTHAFSLHALAWFARLLEWALAQNCMPSVGFFGAVFHRLRPPALPAHTVASSPDGTERCVRCLLPVHLLHRQQCLERGTRSHTTWAIGGGVFCIACGAYSFKHVRHLAGQCKGRPSDGAARWRISRMAAGRHPATGVFLGQPRLTEPALEAFYVILGEGQ